MKNRWLFCAGVLGMAAVIAACSGSSEKEEKPKSSGKASGYVEDGEEYLEKGDLEKAGENFRSAMAEDPKNMDARIGAAKVQMERKAYGTAADSLAMALRVNPAEKEVYELFLDLAREADNIDYAKQAVSLAEQYDQEWFLDEYVPPSATAEPAAGSYGEDTYITLQADSGLKIYYTLSAEGLYVDTTEYREPIRLPRGNTTLSFYTVQDHIPGKELHYEYKCEYPEHEVTFKDPVMEVIAQAEAGKEGRLTNYDCEGIRYMQLHSVDEYYNNPDNYQVKTLEDLKMMPYCTTLYLSDQIQLPDLKPLAGTAVSTLELQSCNITSLEFLKDLPGITDLYVQGNMISDLTPLESLDNLEALYIDDNPVADFSPVLKMESLRRLGVSASDGIDIGQLSKLENLASLDITGDGVTFRDCSPVKDLTQLTDLTLQDLQLTDISFLAGLTEMEDLYLSRNQISDLRPLAGLENLQYLYLNNNQISDLSPLENLKGVTYLNLNYNENITDITPLEKMAGLRYLYLRGTGVSAEQAENFRKTHPTCTVNY